MRRLIVKRLAGMAVIILALTAVLFVLQKISPLDPVHAMLGSNASSQALAAQRHRLGLDPPLADQYGHYLARPVRGNFGTSYPTQGPVTRGFGPFCPRTPQLTPLSLGV